MKIPSLSLFVFGMCALIITPLLLFAATRTEEEKLPRVLEINGAIVRAEIAATPEERRAGFSHREPPSADEGILFVFPRENRFCLWMRDVDFPLDAAFIDEAGGIIGAATMAPHTETLHCAPRPALYALEVNAGWLQKNQVQTGDAVAGLPSAQERRRLHSREQSAP